ncbi:hypothetical protein [Dysgonomonas sp. BGC7]|uniref:hypothetical protein n=1 Tax=Dysgonomonas sp. BGC7 TaxID=1658008 RepID=UPI00068361C0|nr:hypothetical protein [Dysgonomonas sp. BGC7]MBD8387790.1 hypothetical protein [Dysgonomonas sp. BGC7]
MIKIEHSNLNEVALQYLERIKSRERRKGEDTLKSHYIENIESFILALPTEFAQINEEFAELYHLEGKDSFKHFNMYMENQYRVMCCEDGYWLSKQLNINTCPYCNRQYTFTIDRKKKARPQFDHFLSKSAYPHLALSFYNLIPCCSICNHIKSDDETKLLHPYFEGFGDNFNFNINHRDYILNETQINVMFNPTEGCTEDFIEKCKNNVKTFALQELYQQHVDYIAEVIDKAYAYNKAYYIGLVEDFSKLGKTPSEINKLIFGNYIDKSENQKRPLSKLTSDLLKDVGLK